jgi:uncharacterized Zn-binding protein involved in type VI secretion
MPAACLAGDLAVGAMTASQSSVKFNGKAVIVNGDAVVSHGIGAHAAATVTGTSKVKIGGKAIVMSGDVATCAHTAVGTSTVIVG